MRRYRRILLTYVAPDADLTLFKFARRAGDHETISNAMLPRIYQMQQDGLIQFQYD